MKGLSNKALAGLIIATIILISVMALQGAAQLQTCVWPHTCATK